MTKHRDKSVVVGASDSELYCVSAGRFYQLTDDATSHPHAKRRPHHWVVCDDDTMRIVPDEMFHASLHEAVGSSGGEKTADLLPLRRLASIWERYVGNDLDDEARLWWGASDEKRMYPDRKFSEIELYSSRGGACLLTLEDCRQAWQLVHGCQPRDPRT